MDAERVHAAGKYGRKASLLRPGSIGRTLHPCSGQCQRDWTVRCSIGACIRLEKDVEHLLRQRVAQDRWHSRRAIASSHRGQGRLAARGHDVVKGRGPKAGCRCGRAARSPAPSAVHDNGRGKRSMLPGAGHRGRTLPRTAATCVARDPTAVADRPSSDTAPTTATRDVIVASSSPVEVMRSVTANAGREAHPAFAPAARALEHAGTLRRHGLRIAYE